MAKSKATPTATSLTDLLDITKQTTSFIKIVTDIGKDIDAIKEHIFNLKLLTLFQIYIFKRAPAAGAAHACFRVRVVERTSPIRRRECPLAERLGSLGTPLLIATSANGNGRRLAR